MENTQFIINRDLFQQKDNLGMGEILAPFMANICLGGLENDLRKKEWFPKVWIRYMDDILAIIKHGSEDKILQKLNSQKIFPSIRFTMEKEKDNVLPFLDLKIIRQMENIKFDIYREPTSTQQYIPADSNHPWSQKIFNSMLHRLCITPLDSEAFEKEFKFIIETAELNGYNKLSIQKLLKNHRKKQRLREITTLQNKPDKTKNYLVLPYVPELTHVPWWEIYQIF